MANDWRDWFRSKLHPDQFAHPDSPAGGAGTGFARPPGPQQRYSWSSSRVPHPDSPAGRHFDWQSELLRGEHQEHERLTRQIEELERFLAKQSAIFRENLPDPSLKDLYDRQTDRTKTSGFGRSIDHVAAGTTPHLNSLLQPLENHIQWFDTNSRDLPLRHELRILLGTKQIAWEHGILEEKRELLKQVRGFAERFYEAATKSVQKQWAEARRSGKQEELIERWKRQLLQPRIAYSGSGIGQTQWEIEEQQRSKARPEKRPEPPPRTPTVVKTWVEFQLIDEEDGEPVPNASYRVKLPDGSVRDGRLDSQGMVRFENIDPGQCEITFSEIDAREWHRV
jgi:hypothetical protein